MIEEFNTLTKFIFRNGTKTVAEMSFKDLVLVPAKGATREELKEAEWIAKDYYPGQILWLQQKQSVILGPEREFTHEITLRGYGNPDFQQYSDIAPKMTVRCCSVDEAKVIYRNYSDQYELGGGNCGPEHGVLWDISGKRRKRAGHITYGGRFWAPGEYEAWCEELKQKHAAK